MNPSLEFSQKFMVGYNAACKPLCQELKLPQTALDMLPNTRRPATSWRCES